MAQLGVHGNRENGYVVVGSGVVVSLPLAGVCAPTKRREHGNATHVTHNRATKRIVTVYAVAPGAFSILDFFVFLSTHLDAHLAFAGSPFEGTATLKQINCTLMSAYNEMNERTADANVDDNVESAVPRGVKGGFCFAILCDLFLSVASC